MIKNLLKVETSIFVKIATKNKKVSITIRRKRWYAKVFLPSKIEIVIL